MQNVIFHAKFCSLNLSAKIPMRGEGGEGGREGGYFFFKMSRCESHKMTHPRKKISQVPSGFCGTPIYGHKIHTVDGIRLYSVCLFPFRICFCIRVDNPTGVQLQLIIN